MNQTPKRSHKRKVPILADDQDEADLQPLPSPSKPVAAPSAPTPPPDVNDEGETEIELDENGDPKLSEEEEEKHRIWDLFAEGSVRHSLSVWEHGDRMAGYAQFVVVAPRRSLSGLDDSGTKSHQWQTRASENGLTGRHEGVRQEYHDIVVEAPLEYQRNFLLLTELEHAQQQATHNLHNTMKAYLTSFSPSTPPTPGATPNPKQTEFINQRPNGAITSILKACQMAIRAGEDKVGLAVSMYESVDRHIRRLDDDLHKYEDSLVIGLRAGTLPSHDAPSTSKKSPPGRTTSRGAIALGEMDAYSSEREDQYKQPEGEKLRKRKRDRKRKKKSAEGDFTVVSEGGVGALGEAEIVGETSLGDVMVVDPTEPTYCYCEQVSYGEMIGCENDDCAREWFHLGCVGLEKTPSGDWYCSDCKASLGLKDTPAKKKARRR
ncbi:hypothetical protein P7C70_g403, partial [Phenoliferia sp. Uapishka_3]